MALDVEKLLAPVSEDEPAGPDLAYDAGRQAIEQAFETSISIDSSGEEAAASEVDWRQVINNITAQSAQTKDVWLAVYLARAGAMSGDMETVEGGVKYLAGLLEQYWPSVHPQLEEYGFQGRKGPCDSLAGLPQFINPLTRMKILRHARLGEYSGADFERFRSGGDGEDHAHNEGPQPLRHDQAQRVGSRPKDETQSVQADECARCQQDAGARGLYALFLQFRFGQPHFAAHNFLRMGHDVAHDFRERTLTRPVHGPVLSQLAGGPLRRIVHRYVLHFLDSGGG